jgi:MFS family permease
MMHIFTKPLKLIYLLHALVALQYFLVIYINASYLSQFTSTQGVALIFTLGSLLSLAVFFCFSWFIRKAGNFYLTLLILCLLTVALATLALTTTPALIFIAACVYLALAPVVFLNLDVFLEKHTTNEHTTGTIRGFFMTTKNATALISTLLVSLVLYSFTHSLVYSLAGLSTLFTIIFVVRNFSHFKDAPYRPEHLVTSFKKVFFNKELRGAWIAQLLLYLFYGWMIVYTPLYLVGTIGFTLSELALLFTIMLVPFLLLQYPLGKLSDALGEKWILVLGFLVLSGSVLAFATVSTASFFVWAAILFMSRVGAAAVEIASETHYFRLTKGSHIERMELLRAVHPFMYVVASVSGALLLNFFSLQASFVALALTLLAGCAVSLSLTRYTSK